MEKYRKLQSLPIFKIALTPVFKSFLVFTVFLYKNRSTAVRSIQFYTKLLSSLKICKYYKYDSLKISSENYKRLLVFTMQVIQTTVAKYHIYGALYSSGLLDIIVQGIYHEGRISRQNFLQYPLQIIMYLYNNLKITGSRVKNVTIQIG